MTAQEMIDDLYRLDLFAFSEKHHLIMPLFASDFFQEVLEIYAKEHDLDLPDAD